MEDADKCLAPERALACFASNVALGALGGSLAGNMFTTKTVVEMAGCLYDSGASEGGCVGQRA